MNLENLYYSGEVSKESDIYNLLDIILEYTEFDHTITDLEKFSMDFPNFDKNTINELKDIFNNICKELEGRNELTTINDLLIGYNINDEDEEFFEKGIRKIIAYKFADKLNGIEEVKKNITYILKKDNLYETISANNKSLIGLFQDFHGDLHFEKHKINKVQKDFFCDNKGYYELDNNENKEVFNIRQYPIVFYIILLRYIINKYKNLPEELNDLLSLEGIIPNATCTFDDYSLKIFRTEMKNNDFIDKNYYFQGRLDEYLEAVFINDGIEIYSKNEGEELDSKNKLVFTISDEEVFSVIKALHKFPGRNYEEIQKSYLILLEYYK